MNLTTVNYSKFRWVDVEAPTKAELEKLADENNLPAKLLLDCLNPEYLPHIETHGATHFIVIRTPEPNLPIEADTVQELTTKIAFFITQQGLLTVHRQSLSIVQQVRLHFNEVVEPEKTTALVLSLFLSQVAQALISELSVLDHKTENFEQNIFFDHEYAGWRCINCGAIVDPVIAAHRRLTSQATASNQALTTV